MRSLYPHPKPLGCLAAQLQIGLDSTWQHHLFALPPQGWLAAIHSPRNEPRSRYHHCHDRAGTAASWIAHLVFVAWDTQEVESPLHNRTRSPIDQDNQGEGNRRSDDDATDTLEHPLESIHGKNSESMATLEDRSSVHSNDYHRNAEVVHD